ncbi:MAG: hypothetical protein KO464_03675 [Candidatus Methanofastidiosum sp.]|nr:hypothetical protein [Methanofastidiosum sp.]
MTDFKNIKTGYVRNKLKGLEYNDENAKYIQDLMFLERAISGEKLNYIAGMSYESKKDQYPLDFKEIYTELDPDGYKQYLANEEQRRRKIEESRKQHERRMEEEEALSMKSWEEVSKE